MANKNVGAEPPRNQEKTVYSENRENRSNRHFQTGDERFNDGVGLYDDGDGGRGHWKYFAFYHLSESEKLNAAVVSM